MSDDLAARVALVGLRQAGPARIRWLLTGGSATEVVEHLRGGRLPVTTEPAPPGITPGLVARWGEALRQVELDRCLAPYQQAGITVMAPGRPHWPLADDPEPPVVLFARGRPELAAGRGPAVAVVGTRRCTAIGRRVAFDLGSALAETGVTVVSGLATGIDGAAHRGALAAGGPVVGVVGTGLDVIYPKANRDLWGQVAGRGLLLSEAVLGAGGERWRFPARNRLIAGLVDTVVVVESHHRGGSLHTVDEAIERGRPVLVVPGAVTSPASAGTNRLLVEGATPVCTPDDVLDVLGITSGSRQLALAERPEAGVGREEEPLDPVAAAVLTELAAGSAHVDRLVEATGRPISTVLAAVDVLHRAERVSVHGSTVERIENHDRPGREGYARRP
jgi:DNA processing protein